MKSQFASALFAGMLISTAAAANWTDRGEYDLVLGIRAEPLPQKRIDLLESWAQKYPKTELKQMRRELLVDAYEAVGNKSRMLAIAREMLVDEPDSFVALYWVTVLAPVVNDAPAETQIQAADAARRLSAGLPGYFSPTKKPSWMKVDEWTSQQATVELLTHRTIGWAAWRQKDFLTAEKEFHDYLAKKPSDGEISSWLGMVLAIQNDPAKKVGGMWQLARAASLREDGALPDSQRRQVQSLLTTVYTSYHGSSEGLDPLRDRAVAAVQPPADFAIETAEAIAIRRAEEELNRTNPELAAWLRLRKKLEAPDGDAYFQASVQRTNLPRLKGSLIRSSPTKKPTELVIGVGDASTEEVVVKLSSPMPNDAEPGTLLNIEAIAESFSRTPFQLMVSATPENIVGWPEPPNRRK